jgi:uncharacterized protein YlaN (UPF0358 family)
MPTNPLQQYFRQPKVYISLPSQGVFNELGTLQGDATNMPVFGMTGMDEIVVKTPDSLMSGESTVRVIQSCCPVIKDAWKLSTLDLEVVLAAIRIATYGNEINISHTCPHCKTSNDYTLDLSKVIEHFKSFAYNGKVNLDKLTINLRPLTYKQATEFNIKNYNLQRRLAQTTTLEDEEQQKNIIQDLFKELGVLQNEIFSSSIDSVEIADKVVNEREFIMEWLQNCDKDVFDRIKEQFETTRIQMRSPPFEGECDNCHEKNAVYLDLDESSFFAKA